MGVGQEKVFGQIFELEMKLGHGRRSSMWHIYVLLCRDGSYYTGSTNDLEKRFAAHVAGLGARYTRAHPPLRIIHTEDYPTKSLALKREWEIKSWTRPQKVLRLGLAGHE